METITEVDYVRQRSLFDPSSRGQVPIKIIGGGAIGSMATLMLAKVGFTNIEVYDFDRVEAHNIPNQFYPLDSIGEYKVMALKGIIKNFTGVEITANPEAWCYQPLRGIVISSVDSMKVRKELFDVTCMDEDITWMIDPRMGGLEYRVLIVNKDRKDNYSWYPDSEAVQDACGAQSIMFNVGLIGSIVGSIVCDIANGNTPPVEIVGHAGTLGLIKVDKKEDKQ